MLNRLSASTEAPKAPQVVTPRIDVAASVRNAQPDFSSWEHLVSVNGAEFTAMDPKDAFSDCPKDRLTDFDASHSVRVDTRPNLGE